jgi:hypothetical protein
LHIGTKPFSRPKLPTTAGSEFSSLTEDPVLGEKRRIWRESVELGFCLARGKLETPELYRVKLLLT